MRPSQLLLRPLLRASPSLPRARAAAAALRPALAAAAAAPSAASAAALAHRAVSSRSAAAAVKPRVASPSMRDASLPSGAGSSRGLASEATSREAASSSTAHELLGASAFSSNPTSALHPLPPGFEMREGAADRPAYAVFTQPLERSGQDDRAYRLVRLANGLEALLVHDAATDKASAALDVRVGHLSDPLELQGLAHFCEHLLFMGTQKYPRENEHSEFLSNHSGSSNAYTGMENTNYFFDVGHAHLTGALDRFSQFFQTPLFDAGCTEREIRAVDSEHKKNLQSDAWRAFQLEKSLSRPDHPYSHFGTGNLQTLWEEPKSKGLDVRDELLKFHDRYYSANTMKLVVLGRESLDELTDLVVDMFSGVRNKGIPAPSFPSSPLGAEQLQTQVFFRSVKDIRLLDVTFPIPDQSPHFRSKPGQFLSHFIGHEGAGSVLSNLKARGWANHLSAGATNGADGFEFFKISIDLTQDGLANYQDVVASIFRYIDLLRASDFPEWAFREVQQLCELAFRFKEKAPPSSYASALSSQMQLPFPREWVLSGPYLTRDFNVELIRETAACLRPENCRIAIAAQTLPNGTKEWDARERWYGTEYALSPLPSRLLSASQPVAGQEDLALPAPNSFIPSDFAVPDADRFAADGYRATKRPVLLRSTPRGRLWHKRDDQFFMPKANVFMLLRSPLLDATPSNAVKSRLIVELVKDALTEYSYDAELAGLGYNIESQADGIGLSVDGYNDKLAVLCRYILEELAAFKVNAQRFGLIKDQVRRGYENFRLEAPYQHANYYATYLLVERMWTAEEKLRELDALTVEDVQRFLPDLLGRLHVEMLVHGNLQPAQAVELAELAESTLRHAPLSPAELLSHRSLVLPRGSSHAWQIDVSNADNVNSSIEYYCQVGDPSDIRQRATLALLAQIAQEPCFDQLRTKEQLGYLVFSSVRKSIGSMGFRILVQSERDAAYVESRIDAFLDTFKAQLEGMTDAEFAAQRDSLAHKKLEVPKNLYEESSRFWFHIHSGYYDFLQRDVDVAALRQLERKDVVAMFNEHIHQSSSTRAKLTVHMRSKVKPVRFSRAAAEELRAASAKLNVPTSDEEYAALQAQQPSVETVKEATRAALARLETSPETTQQLLTAIDELAAKHPLQEEEGDVVPADATAGVTLIEDPVAFKASLQPSRAAQPVRPWAAYEAEPQGEERGYGAAAADARQLAKI